LLNDHPWIKDDAFVMSYLLESQTVETFSVFFVKRFFAPDEITGKVRAALCPPDNMRDNYTKWFDNQENNKLLENAVEEFEHSSAEIKRRNSKQELNPIGNMLTITSKGDHEYSRTQTERISATSAYVVQSISSDSSWCCFWCRSKPKSQDISSPTQTPAASPPRLSME
jgi:hypothetical protein